MNYVHTLFHQTPSSCSFFQRPFCCVEPFQLLIKMYFFRNLWGEMHSTAIYLIGTHTPTSLKLKTNHETFGTHYELVYVSLREREWQTEKIEKITVKVCYTFPVCEWWVPMSIGFIILFCFSFTQTVRLRVQQANTFAFNSIFS